MTVGETQPTKPLGDVSRILETWTGVCDYCGCVFERKNNHQRRFCTHAHAQAWHNEARDYGFENYVTKAKQQAAL